MRIAYPAGSPLARAAFACAAALAVTHGTSATPLDAEEMARRLSWIESPYHRFGPPQVLLSGRAVLRDEADDAAMRSALSSELKRLFSELYAKEGWRVPFAEGAPLQIYVARREAAGVRQVAARSVDAGKLVSPAILLDGTGLTAAQIVREVSREVALATLSGYGASEDRFLDPAVAAFLAEPDDTGAAAEDLEILAASPTVDLRRSPATLGRLWIAEIARDAGGADFLRLVWERAAETGEAPMTVLLRMFAEVSGESPETPLLRFGARLYAAIEPEAGPSRLRRLDLVSGALDAAPPEAMTLRHRSFVPEDSEESLRIAWPQDGGYGAAIVRYRDTDLPPDVVFFRAGDLRTVPLSGVARVDWLVAGNGSGDGRLRAPVYGEASSSLPFSGLEPHASAGSDGPRLWWKTASHEGLWGWAVFREEVAADGRIARSGPELVPSAERGEESFGYVFVDRASAPGTFYRYTVWAVTDEGLLARAFAATLKTSD